MKKEKKEINTFCVIDIETRGLSARPESFLLGCLYSNTEKIYFLKREEMIKYLLTQKKYKYVFAHNAEYDFTVLFDNILKYLDREAVFAGSMFIKAQKNNIIFLNSLAVLRSSVSSLGKASGFSKLVLNDKFKNPKKNIKIEKEDIEYCFRDCEIVYNYLEKIFYFTDKIKPTIAGCAMHIFVAKFLKTKIYENVFFEKFRHSYYGGRVECFRFGRISPCYKYDINSLYPFSCVNMLFPDFNKIKKGNNHDVNFFENYILKKNEGCGNFTVKHSYSRVCTLPYRHDQETIYPHGIYTSWYNFNELKNSIEKGFVEILEVHEYYYAPPFKFECLKNFMKFFYEKKENSNGAEKLIFKFILNSLTGKFAQRSFTKKIYFENVQEALNYIKEKKIKKDKINIIHFNKIRDDVFLEIEEEKIKQKDKARWAIPVISSYITSQSRIIMLKYFLKYKNELIYTDTDSLVVSSPINPKYIKKDLGFFKKENENAITVKGNKHYVSEIDGKKYSFIKGIKKEHEVKDGMYCYKKMIRTKESFRLLNKNAGEFIETKKRLKTSYTKRKVLSNGLTEPIFIRS